MINILGELSF